MSFHSPSSLTLAGHLELIKVSKSRVAMRKKRHRYWFLFDERNCQLRYYTNEVDLKTSQGHIDMTSCRISLSLENSEIGQRTVILSQKAAEYHLLASSPQEAQRWYVGLQDKKERSKKAKRASLIVPLPVVIPNKKQDRTCYSADNLSDTGPFDIQSQASKSPIDICTPPPLPCSDVSTNGNWNGGDSPMPTRSQSFDDMLGQPVEVPPRRPASTDLVGIEENVDFPITISPPMLPPKSPTMLREMAELPPEEVIREGPPDLPPRETHVVLNQITTMSPEVQTKMSHLELQVNALKRDMDLRNKQLEEQHSLNEELRKIVDRLLDKDPDNKKGARRLVSDIQELQTRVQHLESVNKTLNLQLMKAQEKEEDFEQGEKAEEIRYKTLERDFLLMKANHVKWLARMLSVPSGTSFTSGPDVVSREEELIRSEIIKMLQSDCPPEEVCQIFNTDKLQDFQDECGDTYYADNETLAYAYLTRRLYLRYTQHEQAEIREKWKDFFKNVKVSPRGYLELWDKKKELKCNLLMGLPLSCGDMRVQLWTSLITRWIDDVRTKQDDQHGGCYYTCLLEKSQREESIHEKQISLDLERTLPSNLLFKPETEAIYRMYNVLMAFVHHAPETGYTQGMNQLVALSLFFLDEKMAFWCLVAIVQKILPNDYYSHGLIGAQADQAVLLEMIAEKMPDLAAHFTKADNINVTWVTLNWFITLFVDALPTEPTIRLWDFVLLEGRIVLFKFALGMLKMYKSQILKISDSVTLLQFLKGMTRQTFNVEEMCKEAYETKVSHSMLKRFDHHYLRIKAEHVKMEKEKDELTKAEHERLKQKKLKAIAAASKLLSSDQSVTPTGTPTDTPADTPTDMPTVPISHRHFTVVQYLTENPQQNAKPRWICSCPCRKNEVWLVFQIGKRPNLVISVTVSPVIKMDHIEIRIPKDPMCMHYNPVCGVVLVGTLDFRLLAFDIADHKQLWIFKLSDSILCISSWKNSTFVGLADGSVATFENLDQEGPQPPRMVKLGSNAILAMLVSSTDQLWCAVGNSIITLDLKTLEQNDSTGTDDDQQRNVINSLSESSHGVWGSYRSSTIITLFDITTLVKLLHIDYKMVVIGREVPDTSDQTIHDLRITGFLVNCNILWVGTGGGSVLTFEIQKSTEDDGQHTKERRNRRFTLRTRRSVASTSNHGLLVSGEKESEVRDLEASVRSELVIPSQSPLLPSRMRFTTMHRTSKRVEMQDIQSAYQLKFITGQSVAKTTDHVRKFIAFNDEKFTYIMSCVRASHDESNPIQIWNCKGSDPLKWSFRNLDYVSFVQSPDFEESH